MRGPERAASRIPAVEAAAALASRDAVFVDLRSPGEFAEDHAEHAHNVPLFDDVQRALIGTLFRKDSPQSAFEAGRTIVHEHVVELVERIGELAQWIPPRADLGAIVDELTREGITSLESRLTPSDTIDVPPRAVVLCCHRGGLRSRSVAALLRGLGLERAVVVRGGYKSCRRVVTERLRSFVAPRTFVLRGLTGVGKTLVLREVERLRPTWTIDLEELAQHRSSILGMVGRAPATQKIFETRVSERIARGFDGPLVLEGESRKVGDVILPPSLWRALSHGTNLELVADSERRVTVLVDDYLADARSRAELAEQLGFIEQRLGEREWDGVLVRMLEAGRERDLARLLLERYYDPRYRHSEQGRTFAASFDSSSPAACAERIVAWIEPQLVPEPPAESC